MWGTVASCKSTSACIAHAIVVECLLGTRIMYVPIEPTPTPESSNGDDNNTTDVIEESTQEVDMVTTASNATGQPNMGLADGELAGIVVGVVAFIVLLGLLTSIVVILR